mgnify:CR=1 FL=1
MIIGFHHSISVYGLTKWCFYGQIRRSTPVFTGIWLGQPALEKINYKNIGNDYDVTNNIMKNSFIIGCNHGLNEKHLEKIKVVFKSFLDKF